jgi:hypothetical protein
MPQWKQRREDEGRRPIKRTAGLSLRLKFQAINKAYAILSDPAKRDCYDRGEREPSDDDGPSHGRMRPYGGCSTVHTASEPTRGGYQNMETVLVNSGLGDLFPPMRSTLVGGTVNYAVLHSMIDTELEECGLDFVRDAFWKAAAEKFQCRGCGHRIGSLNEVCYCREVAKMHCHCLNVCCTKVKGK